MDRLKKIELIQRSLGLRHKLKVHETMKAPETHEDFAVMINAKWELEDELHAIEAILAVERERNTEAKRLAYIKEIKQDAADDLAAEKDTKKKSKK
jgi:hypothetical protein